MILKNIDQELADCREAWAAAPTAQWAHGLHHDRHIEKLTEPIENRICYIWRHKHETEQAVRFRWLRPWLASVPMLAQRAEAAKEQAEAAKEQAFAAKEQAFASWEQAYAAKEQAFASWEQACCRSSGEVQTKHFASWEQAYAAKEQAFASWEQAEAAKEQAFAAKEQAFASWESSAEFQAEHARLFPDCPWDGETFLNEIA